MVLRELDKEENGKTRTLWEKVFTEDTKEFLDYYYFIKARDNQIYVIEEEGDIRAMVHLNPYKIRIYDKEYPSFYIVAVATEKEYRGRGYMGMLLQKCMLEMYAGKVPFSFLMPAAEAIYRPYDFRYIYKQKTGVIKEQKACGGEHGHVVFSDAVLWEAEEMASFFNNNFSGNWQICTQRNDEYYRTMILEQQSERGGVRLVKDGGHIVGMFAYAQEDGLEIREPLYLPEYKEDFTAAVYGLQKENAGDVRIAASPAEFTTSGRPVIMARIIRLEVFLSSLQAEKDKDLNCSFAVIDPYITQNSKIWKLYSPCGDTEIKVRETEDSEGVFPVAELTEYLFGYKTMGEIKHSPDVIITGHLEAELEKITKPYRVFLNEIV